MSKTKITLIYHLSYDISEELTDFVQRGDEVTRQWNWAVENAMKGNVSSGSNTYTYLTEWAEFHEDYEAQSAQLEMRKVEKRFKEMRLAALKDAE